jgi:hypothetical protein
MWYVEFLSKADNAVDRTFYDAIKDHAIDCTPMVVWAVMSCQTGLFFAMKDGPSFLLFRRVG